MDIRHEVGDLFLEAVKSRLERIQGVGTHGRNVLVGIGVRVVVRATIEAVVIIPKLVLAVCRRLGLFAAPRGGWAIFRILYYKALDILLGIAYALRQFFGLAAFSKCPGGQQ